jgi:hypothetical protein
LPLDVTSEELAEVFSKYGVLMEDLTAGSNLVDKNFIVIFDFINSC